MGAAQHARVPTTSPHQTARILRVRFPGATHTRLAHCIGVFETARKLVAIINRELGNTDKERADTAVLAALLHDIGHGPFSHTFEQAQRARGRRKRHEEWTAQIIRDPEGNIRPLLESFRPGFADAIADLLVAETPADIYDAIVSSSFDADRLDYLRRDRLMTGSGAGAIDFDWLMENLRIETIDIEPGGDESGPLRRVSFCLHEKAREAAETFLLARFHLYTQVYLHKATRGIEQMLSALLRLVATATTEGRFADIGIEPEHPLARFYTSGGEDAAAYLALDDAVIWVHLKGLVRRTTRRSNNSRGGCATVSCLERWTSKPSFPSLPSDSGEKSGASRGTLLRRWAAPFSKIPRA
jgi:HD superfamily phosphohydrolase